MSNFLSYMDAVQIEASETDSEYKAPLSAAYIELIRLRGMVCSLLSLMETTTLTERQRVDKATRMLEDEIVYEDFEFDPHTRSRIIPRSII